LAARREFETVQVLVAWNFFRSAVSAALPELGLFRPQR
jgi:hypothetical protein